MKDFLQYKDEIQRCSQCGLCMSVCPIYQETKNDCTDARGIMTMLRGVLRGDLQFDDGVQKYLEMCLKCDKCKEFCPSGIDIPRIFESAEEYFCKNKM